MEEQKQNQVSYICRIIALVMVVVAIFMLYFFIVENPFKVGGRKRGGMKGGCNCAVPLS